MSRSLVPSGVPVAPQARGDDELVALWLGTYRSVNTRAAYRRDVVLFRAFVGKPLPAVTLGDVQAFAAGLIGRAAAGQARVLSSVKSLIGFGCRLGYLPFDVAAPVSLPVVRDRLAERILTEEQVQRLFLLARRPRDAALLRLIYGAGLRVSEVCGLTWRDLVERDGGGQVTVLGKGGRTRAILLPGSLWQRLHQLRGNAEPGEPVFASRVRGRGITRSQVHRIMKRACERAGLPAEASVHYLRHSHVSHALDRGAPAHVVQQTVGHASLATTSHYAHVRPGDSSARYLSS